MALKGLNAEIETLKSFFLEQIFVVKKSLKEKHQSVGGWDHVESLKEEIQYLRAENQIKTAIIKTMSEKKKSILIFNYISNSWFVKGKSKSNPSSKIDYSEVLNDVVEVSKENSREKLPTSHSKNNRQSRSSNIVVSTESPKSDDIRNTSRNSNTKDIKEVFVLGDSMVKYVQRWDITKRIDNKRKVHVR